jgi:uncharacterized damage-inducible protein DinB
VDFRRVVNLCMPAMMMAALAASAVTARAQSNPLSAELKRMYTGSKDNITRAAEKMPESDYSFKPAPTVRNFGEEVAHVAQFQMVFCGAAKGEQPANPAEGKSSKVDLLAALKASSDYCDAVYDSLTDASATAPVKLFGRDFTKLGMLYLNVSHNNETYGTMVPYMRIRGIVPPSSEPRGQGKKQ